MAWWTTSCPLALRYKFAKLLQVKPELVQLFCQPQLSLSLSLSPSYLLCTWLCLLVNTWWSRISLHYIWRSQRDSRNISSVVCFGLSLLDVYMEYTAEWRLPGWSSRRAYIGVTREKSCTIVTGGWCNAEANGAIAHDGAIWHWKWWKEEVYSKRFDSPWLRQRQVSQG